MSRPVLRVGLVCIVALASVGASSSHAQALPTATRLINGQIGGGVSLSQPDYANASIKGASIYGSLDIGRHLGIDGEIHDMSLFTPDDIGESTFLLGVRYHVSKGRFQPYGKMLAGVGQFQFQQGYYAQDRTLYYKAIAFGGGMDFALTGRINIRMFDVEYQKWISFPPDGLSPLIGTVGAAYRF